MSDIQKPIAVDPVKAAVDIQPPEDNNDSFDLLGDFKNVSSPGVQDDNAHTERYFSNEQKNLDFGLDPQAFVQRMSASAKETQEQLDAKFAAPANATNQQLVLDFMEAERNSYGSKPPAEVAPPAPVAVTPATAPIATETPKPAAPVVIQAPEKAPLAPLKPVASGFDSDDDDVGDYKGYNKDSDTEGSSAQASASASASVSCNASPAKKPSVADQLKEQDNEKFISSEDLLTDFNEEVAVEAPKPKSAVAAPVPVSAPSVVTPPTAAAPAPPKSAAQAVAPLPPKSKVAQPPTEPNFTTVEEIFCKFGLDAYFKPERLHPVVESLIYWRDLKKSGIVFGVGLVTLVAISLFSVISVVAYLALISLTGAIAFRIYKGVRQALQKTSEGHPFKEFLDFDLTISEERVQKFASNAVSLLNGFTAELRRLFLVEDLLDSLKFAVLLYVLTYIGAWFNGMTLVILSFVSLFTLPKVYENNQQLIDEQLLLVRNKIAEIGDKVKAALPICNKKPVAAAAAKAEKDE